jgi:hypothetical protein
MCLEQLKIYQRRMCGNSNRFSVVLTCSYASWHNTQFQIHVKKSSPCGPMFWFIIAKTSQNISKPSDRRSLRRYMMLVHTFHGSWWQFHCTPDTTAPAGFTQQASKIMKKKTSRFCGQFGATAGCNLLSYWSMEFNVLAAYLYISPSSKLT